MANQEAELVRKIQNISYRIICDIDKYCTENGIAYFLSGGTCLGAVRHHGFIPWDDDADLMMPRPDYERFLSQFEKDFSERYKVSSLQTDSGWTKTVARVWDLHTELVNQKMKESRIGIFVDIIPVDGLPDRMMGQRFYFFRIKVLETLKNTMNRKSFYDNEKYRAFKKLISIFTCHMNPHKWAVRIENIAKKYPFATSEYVGASMALHYGMKERIERSCVETAIRMPFESGQFPVPVGYDRYLSNLYGNYMKIPEGAEEKGYTHLKNWEVKIDCEDKQ